MHKKFKPFWPNIRPTERRSAVMPLLYLAQREKMYVNREDMAEIAAILGITATDVASIVGFYSLYYDQPKGKYHIQVCTDLPCALRGAERFMEELCNRLGIQPGETTADGLITVEAVMCLAACDKAPMFQVQSGAGLQYYENQTVESALALIEQLRADAARRLKHRSSEGGTDMAHNGYVLLRHREIPDLDNLEVYRQNGGFKAFEKVVTKMQPGEVTDVVKASGLRGRGGAGFPTGMKWSFIDNKNWPHYVVANADESEPGTFKDREIMEGNPYQFLEGVAICAYAVQANAAYVYLRGEFWELAGRLDQQIAAMEAAGLLGDKLFGTDYSLRIYTHLGAGRLYLRRRDRHARIAGRQAGPAAPAPALPAFLRPVRQADRGEQCRDADQCAADHRARRRLVPHASGTEKSPGVKIFSLSGCVMNPGNYELPLGTTFRELIFEHGGGIPQGHADQGDHGGRRQLIVDRRQRAGAGYAHGLRERPERGRPAGQRLGDRDRRFGQHPLADQQDHVNRRSR